MSNAGTVHGNANQGRGLHRPGSQECIIPYRLAGIPTFEFDTYRERKKKKVLKEDKQQRQKKNRNDL